MTCVSTALQSTSFIQTGCGYIGTAPAGTQIGDVVTVLLGCNKPMVLRPNEGLEAETGSPTFSVVGACYVHGIIDDEVMYRDPNAL